MHHLTLIYGLINRFNLTILMCLSEGRTLISNVFVRSVHIDIIVE